MDPLNALILLVAGVGGGFIAGLAGVGGGIVFAPVLFFFFQTTGTSTATLAPVTIATSLLCTLTASSVSAWQHHVRASVRWPIALRVGILSAVALYLVLFFVTTRPWYDEHAFQLVFGLLLLAVAARMSLSGGTDNEHDTNSWNASKRSSFFTLGGIGSAAGTIAGLAGVGGGIIMVPAYHQILRLPMRASVGTSSGAVMIISLIGVTEYAISGWSHVHGFTTLGYVDWAHGLVLALPAIPGAHFGARVAHRVPRRLLQIIFATIAGVVAIKMLFTAVSGF